MDLGAGARAPGMGNAFTAVADDLYAVYYNPAGLAQLERPQFSATYSKLFMGLSDGSDLGTTQLTYAHPLNGGKWGGLGAALQRFSLAGAYQETSLYGSWGRTVWRTESGGKLMAGITGKYLSHSFTPGPEAAVSCDQGVCAGGADPVLTGAASKGAVDADLGFLYRFPRRFQVGAMFQHVMRPDVGFGGPDKLPMNIRLAGAYKSLWLNLTTEARLEPAPDGSTDKDLILGAEKFIPTLEHGTFGARGSLGFGSRDWKQVTMGLAYRVNRIELDYAFLMPLGTVQGIAGSHTAAMTFHFGTPTPEEDLTQDLLEEGRQEALRPDTGLAPHDLDDPRLVEVKREVEAGRYRRAYRRLDEVIKELEPDPSFMRLSNRLRLVSNYYPQFTAPQGKWEVVLTRGLVALVRGRDRAGILQVSYALSLNPGDKLLANFLVEAESLTGVKGERVAPDSGRDLLAELLYRMEMYHNQGDYKKVFSTLEDIELMDPDNPTALERAGSTYFVLSRYAEAISAWERAAKLETKQKELEAIKYYLGEARRRLEGGAPKLPAAAEVPAVSTAAPLGVSVSTSPAAGTEFAAPPSSGPVELTAPAPPKPPQASETPAPAARPAPAGPRPAVQAGDPRDIPALYQRGVEHYARGEYLQATAMFMRILQIDPENAQALKALERIRMRAPQGRQ